ncbi:hypothetical protein B296_00015766, partial [Ensete ventricosum]
MKKRKREYFLRVRWATASLLYPVSDETVSLATLHQKGVHGLSNRANALHLSTATSSACRQPRLPPLLCLGFFLLLPLAIPLPRPAPCRASTSLAAGRPTVLVTEKLGEVGLQLLREIANVDCSYNLVPEELCDKMSLYDVLIVLTGTKVTREAFEAFEGRLKVVGRAGVGIDNVDLQAATECGCLCQRAHRQHRRCGGARDRATRRMARNYVVVSLVGKTLAVRGFGKVGSQVARRARGLGIHVIAHVPYAPADKARAVGVELVSFDAAISDSDFISLRLPLTPSTAKIFNDEALAKVKKGVTVVNVARGGGRKDDKLVMHENVTVTPHLGAGTVEAQVHLTNVESKFAGALSDAGDIPRGRG